MHLDSRMGKALYRYGVGSLVFSSCYNLILEFLTKIEVERVSEWTLGFLLSLSCALVAFIKEYKQKPTVMPFRYYLRMSVCSSISSIASLYALRYVDFVTQLVGKSSKAVFAILIARLFFHKSFSAGKYLSVVALAVGVSLFSLSVAHEKSENNQWPGFVLLFVSLVFDGLRTALQDQYIEKYSFRATEMLYQLMRMQAFYALVGMCVFNQFSHKALDVVYEQSNWLLVLIVAGTAAQVMLFESLRAYGGLTTSIVGTCRRAISIALSILIFRHPFHVFQVVGSTLVILSLLAPPVYLKIIKFKTSRKPTPMPSVAVLSGN